MDHNLITTAFNIDGYKIKQNLGIVRGIVVRSRSVFGTIGATLHCLRSYVKKHGKIRLS